MLGSPARVVRGITDLEVERNRANAAHYVRMSRMYLGLEDAALARDAPAPSPFYTDEREKRH